MGGARERGLGGRGGELTGRGKDGWWWLARKVEGDGKNGADLGWGGRKARRR
jgi:hypothetical protein